MLGRRDLSAVRDTSVYLAQLVTWQSLNAARAATRRREGVYVGPWLPELLLDESPTRPPTWRWLIGLDGDDGRARETLARTNAGS